MGTENTAASDNTGQGGKPLALSVKDACRAIGVGNTTLWKLIGDGRLKTITIGRKRLVIYSSLEDLVRPERARGFSPGLRKLPRKRQP